MAPALRSRLSAPAAWPRALALLALCLPCAAAMAAPASCAAPAWPLWQDFQARFIQPDGRVLDASTPQRHTSSEGQSYGMFFALVAGDETVFDRLWKWTEANLAGGDIGKRLPAWFWGQAPDGTWRVLDANAAADADLWLAYDLLEAGRLWNRKDYTTSAQALLGRIEAEETAQLPGLGHMLLPGPMGFELPGGIWRLNASYLPPPVLRRLAGAGNRALWQEIARNTPAVYAAGVDTGYVADWTAYVSPTAPTASTAHAARPAGRFATDPVKGDVGSYDAIRAYMWAGLTPDDDPLATPLRAATRGLAAATATLGYPPESVRTATGVATGTGPFGFSAALLPYLQATHRTDLLETQRARVQALLEQARAHADATHTQAPYYDYVLTLFGLGWSEGRYRFLPTGTVQPSWETSCRRASAP
ncbi:endo-1,4-D-glucanase [Bordetella genomosp. 8]|uniref:cellulase n=1 Tax=Bordetella genomosp. 8 TaxID=1416806 RepID=A0A1W6YT62_9BORD|nr:cellulose synthase complex periplasmic endoglucanase BcsZ [Bordetella genomosp. 8]ARP84282.1 endo-1,4-D-glucanase [Bordetella genomosp. 8]